MLIYGIFVIFKLKFEDFYKIITFELKKIERSGLLHFEGEITIFLKKQK